MKIDAKNKFKRAVLFLAAVCLVVGFVFSSIYIIAHLHHECADDNECSVCICLNACKKVLEELSAAVTAAFIGQVLTVLLVCIVLPFLIISKKSLVDCRIRLNN